MPSEVDFGAYRIADPEEFSRNMLRLMEEGGKVMAGFLERSDGKAGPFSAASEMTDAAKLFGEIAQAWLKDPTKLAATHGALLRDFMLLAGATSQRMLARFPASSGARENRFKDPNGSATPISISEAGYLIQALDREVLDRPKARERTRQRAEFYIKNWERLSPPTHLHQPRGAARTLRPAQESRERAGQPRAKTWKARASDHISQTDWRLRVGRNVAPRRQGHLKRPPALLSTRPRRRGARAALLIGPHWINSSTSST